MPFEPGHKKTGGRQKGTPNRAKAVVRDIVEQALGKTIPEALLEIAQADPRRREAILIELMPYCYARLQSVAITAAPPGPDNSEEIKVLATEIRNLAAVRPTKDVVSEVSDPDQPEPIHAQ